jgi:hypothetical protein
MYYLSIIIWCLHFLLYACIGLNMYASDESDGHRRYVRPTKNRAHLITYNKVSPQLIDLHMTTESRRPHTTSENWRLSSTYRRFPHNVRELWSMANHHTTSKTWRFLSTYNRPTMSVSRRPNNVLEWTFIVDLKADLHRTYDNWCYSSTYGRPPQNVQDLTFLVDL